MNRHETQKLRHRLSELVALSWAIVALALVAPGAAQAQSGPDFWQVTGVSSNDTLNMRSGPGTNYKVVARAPNGTVLRNLGCEGSGSSRWCEVETKDGNVRAWVKGTYLKESGGWSSSSSSSSNADEAPELAVRSSGEIEVRWSSGCTMLYNAQGNRLNAGGSCTRAQRDRSDKAAKGHVNEQAGSDSHSGSTSSGGDFKMVGLGSVTKGGLASGKITSKNGRSFVLVISAPKDGLTCTGSFDDEPGGSNAQSTVIHCTNGERGSALINKKLMTFSVGGKAGLIKFK